MIVELNHPIFLVSLSLEKVLCTNLYYQKLARIIAQEAQDKILEYVFFVSLIRLDFPQRIKDDIYETLIPNYNGAIKQETHFSRWENYVKDFVED